MDTVLCSCPPTTKDQEGMLRYAVANEMRGYIEEWDNGGVKACLTSSGP